jgi:hypothetical protein
MANFKHRPNLNARHPLCQTWHVIMLLRDATISKTRFLRRLTYPKSETPRALDGPQDGNIAAFHLILCCHRPLHSLVQSAPGRIQAPPDFSTSRPMSLARMSALLAEIASGTTSDHAADLRT